MNNDETPRMIELVGGPADSEWVLVPCSAEVYFFHTQTDTSTIADSALALREHTYLPAFNGSSRFIHHSCVKLQSNSKPVE